MKLLNEKGGFTLIEILIATVILTIASLGVVSLTVGVMRGNSLSKRMTAATTLVQDQLEDVKRKGYANVDQPPVGKYGDIPNFVGYRRDMSVTCVDKKNCVDYKMKQIDVTVYWDADKHSVKASTILSE